MNFAATSPGALQAVGVSRANVSLATLLDVNANRVASAVDVLLDNRGDNDAFVLFGGSDLVVTVATGVRIPAGSMAVYSKGNALNMDVIGAGATSLAIHLGSGS